MEKTFKSVFKSVLLQITDVQGRGCVQFCHLFDVSLKVRCCLNTSASGVAGVMDLCSYHVCAVCLFFCFLSLVCFNVSKSGHYLPTCNLIWIWFNIRFQCVFLNIYLMIFHLLLTETWPHPNIISSQVEVRASLLCGQTVLRKIQSGVFANYSWWRQLREPLYVALTLNYCASLTLFYLLPEFWNIIICAAYVSMIYH